MNLFASLRQQQNIDYQESLNDNGEKLIQEVIDDTEDFFPQWVKDLQEYFLNEIKLTKEMYLYCREVYLESPETLNNLDDWNEFVSYSINYIEREYL